MNKYEFVIRFSMMTGVKLDKFKKLVKLFPDGLPDFLDEKFIYHLGLTTEQQAQFFKNSNKIDNTLDWLACKGNHIISYDSPDYPMLLKQIVSAPLVLFAKGNYKLLQSPQIAMVGSRQFSEYGASLGRFFAGELAINGLTITSGLALGIDAICHRGALEVSGNTIAVLGSGLANIAPKTNYLLAQDILEKQGAIVAEFMPTEAARAEYFPRRNRIISGLSLGTFVIEAAENSGSLITARYALEQNRDVFALPGDINNENCSGTHWLIKQGAYLVTKPTDILEHYQRYLSLSQRDVDHNKVSIIHPEIFALIHHSPISVDIIADKLQLPITDIVVKLLDLELEGLIKTVTGGFIRNRISS